MYPKGFGTVSLLDSAEYRQQRLARSLSLKWLGQKTLQQWTLMRGTAIAPPI